MRRTPFSSPTTRSIPTTLIAALGLLGVMGGSDALAQFGVFEQPGPLELSTNIQLDQADPAVSAHLQRVKQYLADQQWDEAIGTLLQVMENAEDRVYPVTAYRYVSLRDYCHLQLAALPAEALRRYRSQIDPLARQWYEKGVRTRDRDLLERVVTQAFASSYGDDALLALGEIALESGEYSRARWCLERIVPARQISDASPTWPGYPDSDLDLARVRARLVLVSILEGSKERAEGELTQFKRLHGDARGRLNGHEDVAYAEALGTLLAQSDGWPPLRRTGDWPTFAGSPSRNAIGPALVDVGEVAWRVALPEIVSASSERFMSFGSTQRAPQPRLCYHPVTTGNLVLVNTPREITALDIATGKPAWGNPSATIYRPAMAESILNQSSALGIPSFTMSVDQRVLFARMGSPWTGRPLELTRLRPPGYLVTLDLAVQGRLLGTKERIVPQSGWSFEGTPVSDGARLYVAMRENDRRPQAYVGCFDTRTGRRVWERFICGADTPGRGMFYENTHNLLTLADGVLYYNTNLGAVAAISARDGHLLWVSQYPREHGGESDAVPAHWSRVLNPCLFHRGTLLLAPSDSPRIFAFDAATGQRLWETGTEVGDVLHLLGTTEEYLIAGGRRLYWIGLTGEDRGRVKHVWPQGDGEPGVGRGVLAGDVVLWPTRMKIHVFDQQTARPIRNIDLEPRGVTGGNLVVAGDGRLLIATAKELIAMRRYAGPPKDNELDLTAIGVADLTLTRVAGGIAQRCPSSCPPGAPLRFAPATRHTE